MNYLNKNQASFTKEEMDLLLKDGLSFQLLNKIRNRISIAALPLDESDYRLLQVHFIKALQPFLNFLKNQKAFDSKTKKDLIFETTIEFIHYSLTVERNIALSVTSQALQLLNPESKGSEEVMPYG